MVLAQLANVINADFSACSTISYYCYTWQVAMVATTTDSAADNRTLLTCTCSPCSLQYAASMVSQLASDQAALTTVHAACSKHHHCQSQSNLRLILTTTCANKEVHGMFKALVLPFPNMVLPIPNMGM